MIVKLANIAVEGDIYTLAVLKKNSLYWHFLTPQFPKIKWSFDISSEYLLGVVQTHGLNVVREEIW